MLKRLFDIVFSLLGLTLVFPILMVLAILIKSEDGGPVFYRGVRVGRYGKPFRIFKFRTMVINAEKIGGSSTADDDPRITRIGKFIRKHKLDELPQLINVLKEEMSFVGPRPEVQWAVDLYYNEEEKMFGNSILNVLEFQTDLVVRGFIPPPLADHKGSALRLKRCIQRKKSLGFCLLKPNLI